MKGRGLQLTLLGFLLITACNKEDFYGKALEIQGADAACAAGTDVNSCGAIQGCQPAFEDVESVDPVFASCIANPPSEEVIVSPPSGDMGSTAGTPTGSSTAGTSVGTNDSTEVKDPPTISEAYAAKCENLDEKYLLIKNYSGEGKSMKTKKVKVCHQTSKGEHAIIVACPALKAHRKHEDYLGACKE